MRKLSLKDQCQNLTSGQGRARSHNEPSRPCCISVDAYMQNKRTGNILSALRLFFQKLEEKTNLTEYDLE